MANFLAELKRRNIYRVGAAYVVVAWALTQFVDVLSQIFELPGSIARPAVIVLAIGFPIALIAAWMIEGKRHGGGGFGSALEADDGGLDPLRRAGAGPCRNRVPANPPSAVRPSSSRPRTAAREAAASPSGAISIAVLPFANLSSDPEQEFFSDGMTEEITAALAKVPDLRVVARTSAFQFKGQNQDLRVVGQALGAKHLIEGSVRKAGARVRITAQLIRSMTARISGPRATTGSSPIFAIQDDIAQAIARALRVPLGLQHGETFGFQSRHRCSLLPAISPRQTLFRARAVDEAIAVLSQSSHAILAMHPPGRSCR